MSNIAFPTYRDIYTYLRTELLCIPANVRNSKSLHCTLLYNYIINKAQVSLLRDDAKAIMAFSRIITSVLDQRFADCDRNHTLFLFKPGRCARRLI